MKTLWDIRFRYFVLILLVLGLAATFWYIREVFQPLLTAGLMAYFLSPVVNFLVGRFRLRRKVSANIVYFVFLAILVALPFTILPAVFDEIQGIMTDFNRALANLQTFLDEPRTIANVTVYLGGLIPALRSNFNASLVPNPEEALRVIEFTSRNFLWLLVVLVTAYYLMTEWDRLKNWLIQLAPEDEQSDLRRLYREIRKVWSGYLGGQIRLILILSVLYSIAWAIIGLPGAVVIGILAGLLNFLPEIGPAIAAILAVIVAMLEGSNFIPLSNIWFAALTLGVYLLLNTFKTVWLQPRILGHSVLLHEGIVFVAIVTAIILQGVLGVLIVVPLLATVAIVGRYIRARLLGLPAFQDEAPASSADLAPASATETSLPAVQPSVNSKP
jgi:predicted PurR-regulated permease PerM